MTKWFLGTGALALACLSPARAQTQAQIRSDLLDAFPKEIPFQPTGNELAWKGGRTLLALVEAYRATKQIYYLDRFVDYADVVRSKRDDRRKIVDQVRGRMMRAWGASENYDKYHVRVVGTGMVTYPLALFARIVKEDPALHARYLVEADRYRAEAQTAVAEFDKPWGRYPAGEWEEKTVDGVEVGYYREIIGPFAGKPHPYNRSLAIGRTHLELHRLGAGRKHLRRATRIARHFKSALRRKSGSNVLGSYRYFAWDYAAALPGKAEDISHGALDMDFVVAAHQAKVVFTDEDLKLFANTFQFRLRHRDDLSRDVYEGEFIAKIRVDGSPDAADRRGGICGELIELAVAQPRIFEACRSWLGRDSAGDKAFLGRARLLKWWR